MSDLPDVTAKLLEAQRLPNNNPAVVELLEELDRPKAKAKKEAAPEVVPVNEFAAFYIHEAMSSSPEAFGVGVHGYVVTQVEAKRGYGLKKHVPTAKGFKSDGKQPLRVIREVVDIRYPLTEESQTRTVANCIFQGCVAVLEYILQMEEKPKTVCLLVPRKNLREFMIKGYEKAVADGYLDGKGNPLPFKEMLDAYLRCIEGLTKDGVTVSVEYAKPEEPLGVKEALALANDALLASVKSREGKAEPFCQVSPPEGYWNHDHGRHPLLGKSRLVFRMSDRRVSDSSHLYLMDFEKTSKKKEHLHKLEIEVGQLLPSASYAVVKVNEVDPIIRQIQEQHTHYLDTKVERLGVMFLDNVFKPGAHSVMSKVGARYLHSTTFVTDLVDSYGTMYTHELNPARQAYRAWNVYLDMESLVLDFLKAVEKDPEAKQLKFWAAQGSHVATEITDRFIKRMEDAKGKVSYKAAPEIETPNTSLLVKAAFLDAEGDDKIKDIQINLAIGIDMPKRNAVAAMANEKYRAFVLVRQDTVHTVRHFVVVTNGDEYGIWCSPFANRTFVKK